VRDRIVKNKEEKTMRNIKLLTLCAIAILASVGVTWAQAPAATSGGDPVYIVNYFTNANTDGAPDGTMQLSNDGAFGHASICAAIYVLYPDEEMTECCDCKITPDGLNTFSINVNLTSNPLVGIPATAGMIKVVATATTSGTCPTYPTSVTLASGIMGWGTHVLGLSTGGYAITETPAQAATISTTELASLEAGCSAIRGVGSHHGLCSCGSVD
jgi:hypothetical protein